RRPHLRGYQGLTPHEPFATPRPAKALEIIMSDTLNGIPTLGLGTYGRTGEEGAAAIRTALELGYRHIDTAQSYDTEENVARAIRESGVRREDVFITTKVATVNLARKTFLPS